MLWLGLWTESCFLCLEGGRGLVDHLFVVVGHFSCLETCFRFLEPLAARLVSGPLNVLRLVWFWNDALLPLPRGTLWSGRSLLWLYTTFDARRLVFEVFGRVLCLSISRLAFVLVCFWYKPRFPCLEGGTRVEDHFFSLETTFLSASQFSGRITGFLGLWVTFSSRPPHH